MGRGNLRKNRPLSAFLIFLVLWGGLASQWALAAPSQPTKPSPLKPKTFLTEADGSSLLDRLGQLKTGLEIELAEVKDRMVVSSLALKYASQAWALAAGALAPEGSSWVAAERLAWLEEKWAANPQSWPQRQTASLRLYFESLMAITLAYAEKKEDLWAFEEATSLIQESAKNIATHKLEFEREAESRVIWSNRLAASAPILARLNAQDQAEKLNAVLSELAQKALTIANRRDVHYQGRMELLFLNNAQGLAKTHFLLAKTSGSPLIAEAQTLENAWLQETKDASPLADQIALTWLTTAQLSFPLAYWLAGPNQGPLSPTP
ncbi:MAG: hypothetical protein LBT38_04715 [Deltaproteobacteria bacterium]|jgi:hypothetical protein|nr:hypothetical protein [Deltaproteobacteria bacterium]